MLSWPIIKFFSDTLRTLDDPMTTDSNALQYLITRGSAAEVFIDEQSRKNTARAQSSSDHCKLACRDGTYRNVVSFSFTHLRSVSFYIVDVSASFTEHGDSNLFGLGLERHQTIDRCSTKWLHESTKMKCSKLVKRCT